jgi:hypothetical protein
MNAFDTKTTEFSAYQKEIVGTIGEATPGELQVVFVCQVADRVSVLFELLNLIFVVKRNGSTNTVIEVKGISAHVIHPVGGYQTLNNQTGRAANGSSAIRWTHSLDDTLQSLSASTSGYRTRKTQNAALLIVPKKRRLRQRFLIRIRA